MKRTRSVHKGVRGVIQKDVHYWMLRHWPFRVMMMYPLAQSLNDVPLICHKQTDKRILVVSPSLQSREQI
jgi:hypothetical protein